MSEKFMFLIEEKDCNLHCRVQCSEMFNEMLKNGDIEPLFHMFYDAITGISKQAQEKDQENQEIMSLMSEIFGE